MTEILLQEIELIDRAEYDLLLSSLGYETRCTFVATKYADQCRGRIAVPFHRRLVGKYLFNKSIFDAAHFSYLSFDETFGPALTERIRKIEPLDTSRVPKILVDVSSMSRPMIARVVTALSQAGTRAVDATFVYCPALFTPPSTTNNPVAVSQPVIPELAGWADHPEFPVGAVVGLGFEHDQALGTLEYLEPASAWAFVPYGESSEFDEAVAGANVGLLDEVGAASIVPYDITDPYRCFIELEALTYGLLLDMRPVLVPFGPKLFALICILIGVLHAPRVTVWRVSGEQAGEPEDRVASGNVIVLRVLIRPKS